MALRSRPLSSHNVMLGQNQKQSSLLSFTVQRRSSTKENTRNDDNEPPAKKARREGTADNNVGLPRASPGVLEDEEDENSTPRAGSPAPAAPRQYWEIPDSEADSDDELLEDVEVPSSQRTDLEQALPPIRTDREAIEEYETRRAAEVAINGDAASRLEQRQWIRGKNSIYVDAFNLALDTVLEDESHLFDVAEIKVFDEWKRLSYEAQYLYVRLFLRKTSKWHRIKRLGYYSDIGDIGAAIEDLFLSRELPIPDSEPQANPGELEPPTGTVLSNLFTFADRSDEHITTLEEASTLLQLDELKSLAKDAKLQGKNKAELIQALRRTSGKQTGIGFASLRRSDTEDSTASVETLTGNDSPLQSGTIGSNRDAYYVGKILAETGRCIRLTSAPLKLFERVHLVFYRSTEWTEKSLTTIILSRISRWNFPDYIVSRSANIFPSRSMLLEFEASLRTQFKVDNILEFNGTPTKAMLRQVLDIFEEIYPRWRHLLHEEQMKEDSIYLSGEGAYLRRLSPAWVYTRLVHKGSFVLGQGKFKEHKREHELLVELLEQRLFHASRRGTWYQRKALLEEHYMGSLSPSEGRTADEQKRHWKRIALQTCEQGLEDNLVHVIHHFDLQKRLTKLEKSLKIPKRLQHEFSHASLIKPEERTFSGTRIERAAPTTSNGKQEANTNRRGAKTIWIDPADGESECSVEAMCLSQYRQQGYKGYHTEGSILGTLFGLLFYDVLFAYIPHVFQTAFQTCPLDLFTDGFYAARMSEINARCAEIANGRADEILVETWNQHFERKTCVVGLRWDFELDDLREAVQCFGSEALAVVCKVIAQEYKERGAGVPDLFLWRKLETDGDEAASRRGEVVFAEVKSENDRLSDAQRLWIHVLTSAGLRVELTHAVAERVRGIP